MRRTVSTVKSSMTTPKLASIITDTTSSGPTKDNGIIFKPVIKTKPSGASQETTTGTGTTSYLFIYNRLPSALRRYCMYLSSLFVVLYYIVYIRRQSSSSEQGYVRNSYIVGQQSNDLLVSDSKNSLAVIVAYRDLYKEQNRADQIGKFIPHMVQFFNNCIQQGRIQDYHIYIVEQTDDGLKFNRGKLMNVGFDYAYNNQSHRNHTIFIFHDVDLLPNDDLIPWYTLYPTRPIHLAHNWPKYSHFSGSFGGIISLTAADFQKINGFPNNFWGWGGEDNEMVHRFFAVGNLQVIDATTGTFLDVENESIQDKMIVLQKHKNWENQCMLGLAIENLYTWKYNGLYDLNYSTQIISTTSLHESGKATKITTNLGLNKDHWTNAYALVNSTTTSYYNWIQRLYLYYL